MNITVYLGANEGKDPALKSAARQLGAWIGENGHTLIYGGSKCGLMGELAESTLLAGGRVIGVEPQFFIDMGFDYDAITQLIVTKDMSDRKAKMIELGDAFIAFPGGTGTLEEISEIMSKISLGHLDAPCIIYNLNGYYDSLKSLLDHMIGAGLASEEKLQSVRFAGDLPEIRRILADADPKDGSVEMFDVCDESGNPTGETVSREEAHRDGIRHRTAHVWIVRQAGDRYQALLQRRSMNKDSFPGQLDTSSAGHIPAGEEPAASAVRELKEELGLSVSPESLVFAGQFEVRYEKEFHGKMFRDNEVANVYVYRKDVPLSDITVQKEELDGVGWYDLEETVRKCRVRDPEYCVPMGGLEVLTKYLQCGMFPVFE